MTYAAAHRARVMLLYRRALKTALDWSGDRRQWYARAGAVRSEFEANRVTVSCGFAAAAADADADGALALRLSVERALQERERGRGSSCAGRSKGSSSSVSRPSSQKPRNIPRDVKNKQTNKRKTQETRDAADRLLDKGEALLQEWRHPDPLVPPYWVGGTAFSRNPPMNESIKISLDFGREDGH